MSNQNIISNNSFRQEIRWGSKGFNRLASTLAIILYKTLLKLIGLKLETFRGLWIFGIKVKKVWLSLSRMILEFKTD